MALKVLVISHMYPNLLNCNNGIFVHKQVQELVKQGIELRIISPRMWSPPFLWFRNKWRDYGRIKGQDQVANLTVLRPAFLRIPGIRFLPWSGLSLYYGCKRTLSQLYKDFNFDLIHTHTLLPDGYAGLFLSCKHNVPSFCTTWGDDVNTVPFRTRRTLEFSKKVVRESDQIIAVSNALKAKSLEMDTPKREILVVHTGTDTKQFELQSNKNELRSILGLPQDTMTLLFVGNIYKEKGIFELLEAFRELSQQYENLRLYIIGPDKTGGKLELTINRFQLADSVGIVGNKPHDELAKWYNACDIFVHPSYIEGLPNVIMEAMSCGKPVVATRTGGIPDLVVENETGFLVNVGDVQSLVDALREMITQSELRISMGKKGRERILNYFTLEHGAKQLIRGYEYVLAEYKLTRSAYVRHSRNL